MELKVLTRSEKTSPQGKPRVYFSCHPADFETAFPMIPKDILDQTNCAVWYDPDPAAAVDAEELEAVLNEMQLVVFPVTSRFLREENRARNAEFPLAMKNHIPILPILLENDLGYEFSDTCAPIQAVTREVTDPTATPYETVLKTFLNSVLIGEELAEKVRSAFDAYVFLSYRKKDRRHAQRLMRLIHENEEFRDIAIWYDEFLVPGEGFNEAIADAFRKSTLFAMAVTPHLEEEGNYVMRVEYPMAMDRMEKDGKFDVVPVEMYDPGEDAPEGKKWRISPEKLKKHEEFRYREIESLQDEHRRPELDRTFLEALARIAKKENDGSAQHRFFIGLAYLCGIDTEVNAERALKLIESAATDPEPCLDAAGKLADMYLNGEGVARDLNEAIRWQKLLASRYLDAWRKNHDPDEHKGYGTAHFQALRRLSDMYRDAGKAAEAMAAAREAMEFCAQLEEEVGVREQEHGLATILNRLGSLYREAGDLREAENCFEKACAIYERQAKEMGTQRAERDLSVSQERLGDLLRKRGDLAGADEYYAKAKRIREKLNSAAPSVMSRRDLSSVLVKIGNVRKAEKKYGEAGAYYSEALETDLALAEEVRSPQAWDDYAVDLVKTGDVHKAEGRLEDAAGRYGKAREIFREYAEKTGSRSFTGHYAGSCEKLASARKKLGDRQEAESLYREAVALREKLYAAAPTPSCAHELAAACFNDGIFRSDRGRLERARELWEELSRRDARYAAYRERAEEALREI